MQHFNNTLADDSQRLFNFKAGDSLNEVADYIQPVMQIEKRCNIVRDNAATNATSATIYTTPADKDFYLSAVTLSIIKDVTSTSTSSSIIATVDGVAKAIINISEITLTVQVSQMSLSLPVPIKIDRGTAITVNNGTNVANIKATGTIVGYTVETTKGV